MDLLEIAVGGIHRLLCDPELRALLHGHTCTAVFLELTALLDWALLVGGGPGGWVWLKLWVLPQMAKGNDTCAFCGACGRLLLPSAC
jgi:hypothetical protein